MRLPVLMFCVVCSLFQRQVRPRRQHQRKKDADARRTLTVRVRGRVRRARWVLAAKDLARRVAIRVRGQVVVAKGLGGRVVAAVTVGWRRSVVTAAVVGTPRVTTGVRRPKRAAKGVGTTEREKVSPIVLILSCSVYIPLSFYLSQTETSTYLLQEQSRGNQHEQYTLLIPTHQRTSHQPFNQRLGSNQWVSGFFIQNPMFFGLPNPNSMYNHTCNCPTGKGTRAMGNVQEAMRDHAAWKASNPPSKDAHSATSTDAHSATKRPRLGTNAEPARESTGAYWEEVEAETGSAPEGSEPGSESEAESVGDGAEAMVVEASGTGRVESGNGTGAVVGASGTGGLVSGGGSGRVVSGDGTGALESVVTGEEPEAMEEEEDEVGMVDATLYPWQERLQQKCEFYFIYDLFLVNQFPSAFLIFVICSHFISQRYCL